MTGRERAERALDFRDVDRTPVAGGLLQNPELLAALAGVDSFWAAPRPTLFEAFRRLGCDAILGPVMPKHPDTVTRDAAGNPTDFTIPHATPTLLTPEQVAAHARALPPAAERRREFNAQAAYDEYLAVSRDTQAECPDLLVIPHCLGHAPWFPTSDAHFTYEALLMACSLYPDDVRRMFDHWGESALLRFEAVAQAMVDHDLPRLIWIGQDICDAKGPVLSPDLLRRLYFPQIARAIEPLKQRGVRIVWHADANYRLILDDLIALGIDGFQGFYETPAGIRLEDLARRTNREGQPLLLFGSVATVWVLPHGSVANVEREVERNLNVDAGRGGLLLAPTSSIGPEVPAENVFAMYRHALEYRPGTGAAQP